MAVYHSTELAIRREELLEIADARVLEAQDLIAADRHAGAVFLGGCALECYLKAAICMTLRLEGLPTVFKTHNLEALLLYSGFRTDLEAELPIQESLARIVEIWGADGREKLLYASPTGFARKSKRIFDCLMDSTTGVIPWLRNRMLNR